MEIEVLPTIAEEAETFDIPDGQDLLSDVDLATLDEATVAALYEELQQPDLSDDELDFPDGQETNGSGPTVLFHTGLAP